MKTKMSAKYIVSDEGLEIYYWIDTRKKSGGKKNFIFLHPGSSMNHTSLEPLEQLLDKDNTILINIDPRGTGYSQAPNDKKHFSLEKYSKDIEQILKIEGIEKPDFIGHSSGFMPIIDYVYNTDNAEKIFGICASYHFPETTANKKLFDLFNKVGRYNEIIGSAITGIFHNMNNELRPYNDQSKIYEGKSVYKAIVDVPLKEALNHCISGKEINKWNIAEKLKSIDNQIIMIYGDKDYAVVPEKAGKKILELSKNSDMVILPGKHDLPIKNPKSVAEIIKRYG